MNEQPFTALPNEVVLAGLDSDSLHVYIAILYRDWHGDGWVFSHAELAAATLLGERTVRRRLQVLKERGLVRWETPPRPGPMRYFALRQAPISSATQAEQTVLHGHPGRVSSATQAESYESKTIAKKHTAAAAAVAPPPYYADVRAPEDATPPRSNGHAAEPAAAAITEHDPATVVALGLYEAHGGDPDDPDMRIVRKHVKAAQMALDERCAGKTPDQTAAIARDLAGCAKWLSTKPGVGYVQLDWVRADVGRWVHLRRPAQWTDPRLEARTVAVPAVQHAANGSSQNGTGPSLPPWRGPATGTVYPTKPHHWRAGNVAVCPACDSSPCEDDCPEQAFAARRARTP